MKQRNGIIGVFWVCLAMMLAGPTLAELTIDGYTLVSKTRVSRVAFDYTYQANITNTGADVENVSATLASTSPNTVVVDSGLSFGAVGAGASVSSTDTFTIRQDRRYPFSWSNVSWDISFDVPTPGGVLLQGNPGDLAMNALVRLRSTGADSTDILDGVILNRLSIAIELDATIGEVNQALLQLNTRITDMQPGSPYMQVAIPRQATTSSVGQIADQLAASPAIRVAFPARVPAPTLLPPGHTEPALIDTIEHLLPARFPAAWNATGLIEFDANGNCLRPVTVLVPDVYWKTLPADYDAAALDQIFPAYTITPEPSQPESTHGNHGFDVIATMAAKFDNKPPTGAMPLTTGANPFDTCFEFVGIPVNGKSWEQVMEALVDNFPDSGKFLINVSLGFSGDDGKRSDGSAITAGDLSGFTSPLQRAELAALWRVLVGQARDREDDFLVFSAAGNDANDPPFTGIYPGAMTAAYSNPFSVAAIPGDPLFQFASDAAAWSGDGAFPNLTASVADLAPLRAVLNTLELPRKPNRELNNVLTVGSTTSQELRLFLFESDFSDRGAQVYAVGENIPNLPLTRRLRGTSFAAPQVTGLAAYLWLIAPELRLYPAQITRYLIEHSVWETGGGNSLNLIDAYLAALTFDLDPDMIGVPIIQFGEAPVREAILDIDGDGLFEEEDLKRYLWAYYGSDFLDPDVPPVMPAVRNYSRFDLNGDGFTSGDSVERFDLDLLASPAVTPVYDEDIVLPILLPPGAGTAIQRSFDENALTDFEILCYYAFSPLYYGDLVGTNTLEGLTWLSDCVDIEASMNIPVADIHFGSTVQLGAEVHELGGPVLVDRSVANGWEYFRWSSSDPDVAVVDALGRMHVTGPGTSTIRASYGRTFTTSTLTVPLEGSISRSVPVTVDWYWKIGSDGIGACYSPDDEPVVRPTHSVWNNQVVFQDAVVMPAAVSVDDVGDPAIVWTRATGGSVPSVPVVDAQAGDLILTNYGPGFVLTKITSIGQDSDGCPDASYTVYEYKDYIADYRWRLWGLMRQPVLPYTGGIEQALWVQITPPSTLTLDAGAIDLSTTSLGSALKIEIAEGRGADAVTIEAVAPWIILRLPALNPIDERENSVVILENEDVSYEVDLALAVQDDGGGLRHLVVEKLAGWHCGLGAGPTCPGWFDADIAVNQP